MTRAAFRELDDDAMSRAGARVWPQLWPALFTRFHDFRHSAFDVSRERLGDRVDIVYQINISRTVYRFSAYCSLLAVSPEGEPPAVSSIQYCTLYFTVR